MSSNHIYPYVYKGTHPSTNEFYIGSRCANSCPAEKDLGIIYRTSSKVVNPRFDEFSWEIIAEFFTKEDAYDFEQELIHESWGTVGMLNQSCYHDSPRFSKIGKTLSEETKLKISAAKTGKHRPGRSRGTTGMIASIETREKMSIASKGKTKTPRHRENISKATSGVSKPWTVITNKDPEKIKKTAEKHKGMKRSPEACENIRKAMMKYYAEKKLSTSTS